MSTYIDQAKIGRYIAAKRKGLGLTQAQLADKLGMSDKSVSKWERGVCLPDVSVYADLCDALSISLNEFLAGEDIAPESLEQKSEETILTITKDGNRRSTRLRRIALLLAAAFIVLLLGTVWFLKSEGYFHHNYMLPYDQNSDQYRLAQQLSIPETPYLYAFDVNKDFPAVRLSVHVYDHGKELEEPQSLDSNLLDYVNGRQESKTRGTLAVLRHQSKLSLLIATGDSTARLDYDLPEEISTITAMAEAADPNGHQLEEGAVYPLCAYYCTDAGEVSAPAPAEAFADPAETLGDVEYAVIVTAEFHPEEL